MEHGEQHESEAVSRRGLLTGIGVAAGAGAILGLPGAAGAGAPPRTKAGDQTEILGVAKANLTYLPIDALGFDAFEPGKSAFLDALSGMNVSPAPGSLGASLPMPTGSVVRQINVSYFGVPAKLTVQRRGLVAPSTPEVIFTTTGFVSGGGAKTVTFDLDPGVPVAEASTYSLRLELPAGASVHGVTLGYEPVAQTFIPFSGAVPRIYDSRDGAGKLDPNQERTIPLGFPGARSAVINLTVDGTEGAGGFVSAFRADIAWPGSSSINWSAAGQILANTTVVAMDAAGQIKIRGGAARTHVVIDRIGWLI